MLVFVDFVQQKKGRKTLFLLHQKGLSLLKNEVIPIICPSYFIIGGNNPRPELISLPLCLLLRMECNGMRQSSSYSRQQVA